MSYDSELLKASPCEALEICTALGNARKGCEGGAIISSQNSQICLPSIVLLLAKLNEKINCLIDEKN